MNFVNKVFFRQILWCFLVSLFISLVLSKPIVRASSNQNFVEKAEAVTSFIDSIGVATHLGYNNTTYSNFEDIVKPRLQELGIRHIRTGIHRLENKESIARVNTLGSLGIKSLLVAKPHRVGITETLEVIKSQIQGVEAVEGANEWNVLPHRQYQGQGFPEGVANFQKKLYSKVKHNPVTRDLEVLAPSLAKGNLIRRDATKLGKVPCDTNNMHSYPAGRIPSTDALDKIMIPENKKVCGLDKPIIATETGYNNAVHNKSIISSVSEVAAAKYINRLFLEYFNRGVKRTYSYELIDLQPDPQNSIKTYNWGLLRADGSPKLEYESLRRFLKILRSSGKNKTSLLETTEKSATQNFGRNTLEYTLKSISFRGLANIHHSLLQDQTGTYYLMLWQELNSYDRINKVDIENLGHQIIFSSSNNIAKASTYDPYYSSQPLDSWINPQEIPLEVFDRVLVLKITTAQIQNNP